MREKPESIYYLRNVHPIATVQHLTALFAYLIALISFFLFLLDCAVRDPGVSLRVVTVLVLDSGPLYAVIVFLINNKYTIIFYYYYLYILYIL